MTMADSPVVFTLEGGVGVVRMDDGKANAISHAVIDAFNAALDQAAEAAPKALAIVGRPGRFSAGFDLTVMSQGGDATRELVTRGAELALRIFEWPAPVVLGATGHAMAMGAVLLCTADERIGARGDFKIGLNEVAIGLALPAFAYELARERLARRHFHRATTLAEIYSPDGAVEAGYLDRVVALESVARTAVSRAGELGAHVHAGAHAATKRALGASVAAKIRATLAS